MLGAAIVPNEARWCSAELGHKTGKGGIERDMEKEIHQLKRRVNEQVLQRAEADPQWRQRVLDDPDTAVGDIPEAEQLREMLETTSTTMPTTTPAGEEYRLLRRSFMEKVLDKAANDPTWKQQLLDDPDAAMREANFPEAQQLEELRQEQEEEEEEEVVGHQIGSAYPRSIIILQCCGSHTFIQI
jgi:hypothetical protein